MQRGLDREGAADAAADLPLTPALTAANLIIGRGRGLDLRECGSSSRSTCRRCLGYSPLKTGICVPADDTRHRHRLDGRVTDHAASGAQAVLILGMVLLSAGMALFTGIGVHSDYLGVMLVPGSAQLIGCRSPSSPATIGATTGVESAEAGLASAVANTARLFGGALGLAILATLATTHRPCPAAPHPGDSHRKSGARQWFPALLPGSPPGRRLRGCSSPVLRIAGAAGVRSGAAEQVPDRSRDVAFFFKKYRRSEVAKHPFLPTAGAHRRVEI